MNGLCITDAVKHFGVTSKTLRYYERVGLLDSKRSENNNYRYYDESEVERIRQIMILRKMQISIKDIIRIYESKDMSTVVEVFVSRMQALDEEVGALFELRRIINEFLQIMIKNGIQKISALPLLYEELDKKLEVLEVHKPVTYEELNEVNAKLAKPLDIRIIILPEMRVLTSLLKESGKSDTDYFWKWVNENNIDAGSPGSHRLFEMQDGSTPDHQQAMMIHIPNDFTDAGPFIDRFFPGGLFAVASTYVDEDIEAAFRTMIRTFGENKYYEIDYLHGGSLRHEPFIETIMSPDELREKIDIFVPIKKRLADGSLYHNEKQLIENITWADIEKANPAVQTVTVDFKAMVPLDIKAVGGAGIFDYQFYDYNDEGGINLHSYVAARQLVSNERIKVPFVVEIDCKIPQNNVEMRVCHDKGHIGLQFPDGNLQITVREPVFGTEHLEYRHITPNCIDFSQDTNLKWVVGEKQFAVVINDQVKYCGTNYKYMQLEKNTFTEHPIRIGGGRGRESIILKAVRISSILPDKINKLKKGELRMITKQSNNTLPNLHKLVTYHYGENYNFNACMKMLMEYVEPNEMYTYSFFAGISGDNFVQVYGHKEQYENYNGSLSCVWDAAELIKYVFGEIGYEYTYVTTEQIAANKGMYIETVKAFIDKGIPVLFKQDRGWHPIVGYEENGKVLLFMDGENTEPVKYSTDSKEFNADKDTFQNWLFIGARKKETDFRQMFINSLRHIAELLESPDIYECSYGPRAFRYWADDIENGRFDGISAEQFDGWRDYSVYICNLATNFCGVSFDFLDKAVGAIPALSSLKDEYSRMNEQYKKSMTKLQELEGNFNVTLAALQDTKRRAAIANEIRQFAPLYENFTKLIIEKLGEL